jgi:hypothetical protein
VSESGFAFELPPALYSVACSERYLFAADSEGRTVYALALDGTGALVHQLGSPPAEEEDCGEGEGLAAAPFLFGGRGVVSVAVWRSFLVVALRGAGLQAVDMRAESAADWKVTPPFGTGAAGAGAGGAESFAGQFAAVKNMAVVRDRLFVLDSGSDGGRLICFDGELRADKLRLSAVWTYMRATAPLSMAAVPLALRPDGAVVLVARPHIIEISADDGKVVRSFAVEGDVKSVLFDDYDSRLLVETVVRSGHSVLTEYDFLAGVRVAAWKPTRLQYIRPRLAMDGMMVMGGTDGLPIERIKLEPAGS